MDEGFKLKHYANVDKKEEKGYRQNHQDQGSVNASKGELNATQKAKAKAKAKKAKQSRKKNK